MNNSAVVRKTIWIDYGIPYLTSEAVKFLKATVKSTDLVLEFGAGGSTVFFGEKVKSVITVEHNSKWSKLVQEKVRDNVLIKLLEPKDYKQFLLDLSTNYFDWLLVDGLNVTRSQCIKLGIRSLKSGGYLILDNYDNKLYSEARELLKNWAVEYYDDDSWDCKGTAIYRKPNEEE